MELHRLAGQYDNLMPSWFLAPIAGLKLPTCDGIVPPNRWNADGRLLSGCAGCSAARLLKATPQGGGEFGAAVLYDQGWH